MYKLLSTYIRENIIEHMALYHEDYVLRNPRGKEPPVFLKFYGSNFSAIISWRVRSNYDYITPEFYWSKLGKKEKNDIFFDPAFFLKIDHDLMRLFNEKELVFGLNEIRSIYSLPGICDTLRVSNKKPSAQRVKEIFIGEDKKEVLEKFNIKNPIYNRYVYSWESIEEVFPGILNDADMEYAVGGTIALFKEIITDIVVPYMDEVYENYIVL